MNVKQLVWEHNFARLGFRHRDLCYWIRVISIPYSGNDYEARVGFNDTIENRSTVLGTFNISELSARDCCQAHYEALILSGLEIEDESISNK